jgi:phosphatidylglycerophosphate synthase
MLDNPTARGFASRFIEPIARFLLRAGLTANSVTWIGAILTSASAMIFVPKGDFGIALFLTLIIGSADLLDGTMARLSDSSDAWGSFLDSSLDRLTDAALIASIGVYFAKAGDTSLVTVAFIALAGASVTSYLRAKAESLGASAKIGIAERSERSILIYVGLAGAQWISVEILRIAILILAVASMLTVFQRMHFVSKQLRIR